MKLKKIASLMLAGVMAVGMLTACGGNANSNNGGASSDDTTTTRGYSAVLGDALKDVAAVKDNDYITFQDNSADETALKGALNNLSESSLETLAAGHPTVWSINESVLDDVKKVESAFVDAAKLSDKDLKIKDIAMDWYAGYRNGKTDMVNTGAKDGTLYVVNGAVGVNEAVKQVAEQLKNVELDVDKPLPEKSASANVAPSGSNGNASYKYEYVISVSVAEKALDSTYTGAANSAIFIAVTVTRTVVDGI